MSQRNLVSVLAISTVIPPTDIATVTASKDVPLVPNSRVRFGFVTGQISGDDPTARNHLTVVGGGIFIEAENAAGSGVFFLEYPIPFEGKLTDLSGMFLGDYRRTKWLYVTDFLTASGSPVASWEFSVGIDVANDDAVAHTATAAAACIMEIEPIDIEDE